MVGNLVKKKFFTNTVDISNNLPKTFNSVASCQMIRTRVIRKIRKNVCEIFNRQKTYKIRKHLFSVRNNDHWHQIHVLNVTQSYKCLSKKILFENLKLWHSLGFGTSISAGDYQWARTGNSPMRRCSRNKVDEEKLLSPVF